MVSRRSSEKSWMMGEDDLDRSHDRADVCDDIANYYDFPSRRKFGRVMLEYIDGLVLSVLIPAFYATHLLLLE